MVTLRRRFAIRFRLYTREFWISKICIRALFEAEGFLAFADLNFSSTGTWGTVLIGTEENSSGIAAFARTTSCSLCFLLSGNFLVEAASSLLPSRSTERTWIFLDLFLFMFLFKEFVEDMMHGAKILKIRCKILFQCAHMSVSKLPWLWNWHLIAVIDSQCAHCRTEGKTPINTSADTCKHCQNNNSREYFRGRKYF